MQHSEKNQRPVEHKSSAQSLMIDSSDSVQEQSARDTGLKVINGDQLMGDGNEMSDQISSVSAEGQNSEVDEALREKISLSVGSGDKLAEITKHKLQSNSGELDDVRVHTDSIATELTEALNANAFVVGNDIYFAPGKFNTYTGEGKELLAHEVEHVKQSKAEKNHVLRRSVKTLWGEFDTTKYNKVIAAQTQEQFNTGTGAPIGLEIVLQFKPGDHVDAKSIGMIQATRGYVNGNDQDPALYQNNATTAKRLVTEGTGKGYRIDTNPGDRNPLYAGNTLTPGATGDKMKDYFAKYPTLPKSQTQVQQDQSYGLKGWDKVGLGTYGKHELLDGKLTGTSQPAELHDAPLLGDYPYTKNTGQIFETAAIAVDSSTQEGKYYGTVSWGWNRDENGSFSILPLTLVSSGVPSENFMAASKAWNDSLTNSTGKSVVKMPEHTETETQKTSEHLKQQLIFGGYTFGAESVMTVPAGETGTTTFDLATGKSYRISVGSGLTMDGAEWQLYDAKNQLVFDNTKAEHTSMYDLDLTTLAGGVYTIKTKIRSGKAGDAVAVYGTK